jgi:hypothetical protein
MGHFLMDDGMGASIPTFFKFEPAGNGPSVCRDIGILAQKLGHVKIFHTSHSRQRSLIVTQSATNRGVPVSLNDYLQGDPAVIGLSIPKLITQVVEQLSLLGDTSEDEVQLGGFLWEYLNRGAIEKAWNSCDTRQVVKGGAPSPIAVFDMLKASRMKQWATKRHCAHGDLNATNVTIDATHGDNPQAYIFDAAGMRADFDLRDIATLEVTTILFNSVGIDEQLIRVCRAFYEVDFIPKASPDPAEASPFTQNVFAMIAAIRARSQSEQHRTAYALLVFDASLRQLSGLGLQPSPNKVRNPVHACYLAAWISQWLKNVAPGLFSGQTLTESANKTIEPQPAFAT